MGISLEYLGSKNTKSHRPYPYRFTVRALEKPIFFTYSGKLFQKEVKILSEGSSFVKGNVDIIFCAMRVNSGRSSRCKKDFRLYRLARQ